MIHSGYKFLKRRMMPMVLNGVYRKGIKIGLLFLGIAVLMYIVFRLSIFFLPFVIAGILALLVEPVIRGMVSRLKIPRKFAVLLTLLVILGLLGLLVTLAVLRLSKEIVGLSSTLPQTLAVLYDQLRVELGKISTIYFNLPEEVTRHIQTALLSLVNNTATVVNRLLAGTLNALFSLPSAFIFILVTIISTFFISKDRYMIEKFMEHHFPVGWVEKLKHIAKDLLLALGGYIRAQLILMSIIFVELFTAFILLDIRYALILALTISIVDALPIVGSGSILVPWLIVAAVSGNLQLAVSLLILYAVIIGTRQMLEPKIIGEHIGIHPLITLVSIYAGFQLIGVIGLILGPITVLVFKNIFAAALEKGLIKEILKED